MEFVQFHPTGLYSTNILMTEGARGEGGYLINGLGERYMEKYAPKSMELAPRDIVSRSGQTEINEGRGIDGQPYVYLDLRHLGAEKILERLPGIRDLAIHFEGVDPIEEPIPVVPSQHYSMGGIDTDVDGATAHARPLRRRRVRLRERARGQPPGRQLPARDHRVRPALRGRGGALPGRPRRQAAAERPRGVRGRPGHGGQGRPAGAAPTAPRTPTPSAPRWPTSPETTSACSATSRP